MLLFNVSKFDFRDRLFNYKYIYIYIYTNRKKLLDSMTFNYDNLSTLFFLLVIICYIISCLDSPRVLILNEKLRYSLHDTILVKCRVCSMPQVERIYWLRNEQLIIDENIQIKIQILNDQCSESILNIIV